MGNYTKNEFGGQISETDDKIQHRDEKTKKIIRRIGPAKLNNPARIVASE